MDSEKENVNVVIVPENILQAIKNSSNLSIDIADAFNISNAQQNDNSVVIDTTNTASVPNAPNGSNAWLILSTDNLSLSTDISSVDKSQSVLDNSSGNPASGQFFQSIISKQPVSQAFSSDFNNDLIGDNLLTSAVSDQACSINPVSVQSLRSENDCSHYFCKPHSVAENSAVINSSILSNAKTIVGVSAISKNNPKSIFSVSTSPVVVTSQADKSTYADNGDKELYTCDFENCHQVFKSLIRYRDHKTTVHGKKKSYKCKYANCLWSFSTPYKLRRHLESHYKRKPYSCPFPGCGAVFSSDYNQRTHMKIHTTMKPVCQICGQITSSKRNLEAHMRRVHEQPCKFACDICKKPLSTATALAIHKRSHIPRAQFECPVCKKTFDKRYYLKLHLYTHTTERPFKCDQCNCGFASLARLNRHIWLHSEGRFECTEDGCEKKFHRFYHLVQHLMNAHGIEPDANDPVLRAYRNESLNDKGNTTYFTCEFCGMRCLTSHGLERHKRKCDPCLPRRLENQNQEDRLQSARENLINIVDINKSLPKNGEESIIVEINSHADDVINDDDGFESEEDYEKQLLIFEKAPLRAITSPKLSAAKNLESREAIAKQNWTPPLIESEDMSESSSSSQYLTRASDQSSNAEAPLVRFIDDMNVLDDPTAHSFLQLSHLPSCVDSIIADSGPTDQTLSQDVLQQYVISSQDLNKLIKLKDFQKEKETHDELFEEDLTLVTIEHEEPEDFAGTTINIDDIH